VSDYSGLLGLDVVLVEVLLEIEVGQSLTSGDGQELAESSVRLDVVLVLQALFLDVGGNGLGNIGARHLRTLGLTEESAEVVAQLGRDFKDGEASRLLFTIGTLSASTALTLTGIFDFTVDALVELLELTVESGDNFTEAVELSNHAADFITNGLLRSLNSFSGGSGDRGDGGYRGRSRSSLSLSSGLFGDLLGLGNYRSNRGRSGYNRGSDFLSLLSDALSGGLRGSSVHCTITGGRIHLDFTHYPTQMTGGQSNFFKFPLVFLSPWDDRSFFFEVLSIIDETMIPEVKTFAFWLCVQINFR
jgi:hypothetical protein